MYLINPTDSFMTFAGETGLNRYYTELVELAPLKLYPDEGGVVVSRKTQLKVASSSPGVIGS